MKGCHSHALAPVALTRCLAPRNVYSVWRTVLDETEKLGKCRLAGVEVFQQHISEDAKQTRLNKLNLGKKVRGGKLSGGRTG